MGGLRSTIAQMTQQTVPRIEKRLVCIATNKQVKLAAVISSYFQEDGLYFPVFEFPPIDAPYEPSSDFGKDGYIGRVIGDRVAHQINNALARIQPESILLLGLTEIEKGYLRALLPLGRLIEINKTDEIPERLPYAKSKGEPIRCNSSQIIEGFLLAKFARKHLEIDESAPALPPRHMHGGEGILVVENNQNVHDIVAINYAFAINADVVLVPPVDRQQILSLPRQLRAWSNDNSHHAFEEVKRPISNRIKGINFLEYKFATFFTIGLPYGLIIKNIIPSSHVLKELGCGVFIANNLVEENEPMVFDSALIFSPQLFSSEETDHIGKILENSNYTVKLLLGRDATVKRLHNYGSFFPFDVLHICAHGGETDGYFVTQEFTDRDGNHHKCEFYEVVGVEPSSGDMVKVTRKIIFKTFDGFPWMSKPLKGFPHYVFEDMLRTIRSNNNDGLTRVSVDYPIALSCHIQCHDSIHQGTFQSLAGVGHPLVFNNTCSSSHELAVNFIDAGAGSYIGTLWSVGNETAQRAATVFYEEALRQGNLLAAFFAMNNAILNRKYLHIYIFWGLHFSSFRTPSRKSDVKILEALFVGSFGWLNKIETTVDPEVRRNSIPIVKFLLKEIALNVSQGRMDEVRKFDRNTIEDLERTSATQQEDDFGRGVTEMEISTQQQTDKLR
jgi:hypothetical protein